jgi:hypothetical protein
MAEVPAADTAAADNAYFYFVHNINPPKIFLFLKHTNILSFSILAQQDIYVKHFPR